MPLENGAVALLKAQLEASKSHFRNFVAAREIWEMILNRELPPNIMEELKKYGQTDIETPDVKKAFIDHNAILHLGTTTVNAVLVGEGSQDAKEDVEAVADYLRAWYYKLFGEYGGKQMMNEGQVGQGVAILRITWHAPPEFDWPKQGDDENLPDWASRSMKARDAGHRIRTHNEFALEACSWRNLSWGPKRHDPDAVFEDVEIPYWEAKQLKNDKGEYLSLDQLGKIAWLGTPEPVDQSTNSEAKTVHVLYRAARAPGTNDWKLTTYVYTADVLEDGELLEEKDVPGKLCPYVIVPSGNEIMSATDPHRRYEPGLMSSLYALASEFNQLMTALLGLGYREATDEHIYASLDLLMRDGGSLFHQLEEMGYIDGAGAQRRMAAQMPDTMAGEIALAPRMFRKPESVKEAFYYALDYYRQRISEAMASRFLTGSAFEETKEGTGTAVTNQAEAAQFVYQPYEDKQTTAVRHVLRFIANSLQTWGMDEGKNANPYAAPTTQAYLSGSPGKGLVTLDKLSHPFEIVVITRNETQQERLNRWQLADHDLQIGLIGIDTWAERRDIMDRERWKREMNQQRLKVETAQQYRRVELQAHQVLLSAVAGINAMTMPIQPPMQGESPDTEMPQTKRVIDGDSMGGGSRLNAGVGMGA